MRHATTSHQFILHLTTPRSGEDFTLQHFSLRTSFFPPKFHYRCSNPGWDKRFFSFPKRLVQLRGPNSFLLHGHRVSLPGVKRRWPPSSTDVKNGWRCIAVPPTCLSGVDTDNYTRHCCLISDLLLYYFDITSIYWASGTATNVSITHVLYMLSDSVIPGLLCCISLRAVNILSS